MKFFEQFNLETGMKHKVGDETGYNQYVDDCYIHWLESKVPQNLAKPDAYSLLAEVRALRPDMDRIKYFIEIMERPSADQSIEMVKYIEALEQFISEHFS